MYNDTGHRVVAYPWGRFTGIDYFETLILKFGAGNEIRIGHRVVAYPWGRFTGIDYF